MKTYINSSEKLQTILWDHCVIGLAIVSKDGEFLEVNNAWCKALKYTAGELKSKTFMDITHPEDTNADLSELKECLVGNIDSYNVRKRYITKTGDIIWIDLHVETIRNDNGDIEFFLSQIQIPDQSFNAYLIDRLNEVYENKAETKDSKTYIKSLLEKNLKFIIAMIIGVITYTGNAAYKAILEYDTYQETKETVENNTKILNSLIETIESQNNNNLTE